MEKLPTPTAKLEFQGDLGRLERFFMGEVDRSLTGTREIYYLPRQEHAEQYNNITTVRRGKEFYDLLSEAGFVICIGRDSQPNPMYDERKPEHNIILSDSAESNVCLASMLYHNMTALGNNDVRVIMTGRYNNRALDIEYARPIIAEAADTPLDLVSHLSVDLLQKFLEGKDILSAKERVASGDSPDESMMRLALKNILATQGVTEDSSSEDIVGAVVRQFANFPRISESTLMRELAMNLGVPYGSIIEEPDSVDTISNIVNIVASAKAGSEDYKGIFDKPIVVVASEDHMKRTIGIVDHVLPNGVDVICVESDAALPNENALFESMLRELRSFLKGKNWIGDTRDIEELDKRVERGYFSQHRKSAAQLKADVDNAMQ